MKKLAFLIPLILLFGCAGRVSDTPDFTSNVPDLTEEVARTQIETVLLSLEDYTTGEYKKYFNELLTTEATFEESIAWVVDGTKLHDPTDITVNTLQKGRAEAIKSTVFQVVGTFRCGAESELVSDFYFTFLNNPKNGNWEIVEFKFEEC